tara:strand:- start:988 stop:1359 length:372 start_codon:yes stop_codon:yes gene_type:complete
MASISDYVLDAALAKFDTEANRIDITSQEATTYAAATSTYTLGNKTSISIGAPADRSGGGREVTVSAITDGTVSGTGTATHYAIVDSGNSRLLGTGSLSSSQAVTSGNTFSLASFKIGIPDPA